MDNFVIPELPYGRELVVDIKTTWGDRHYVGMTGIEFFSSTGEPVTISKVLPVLLTRVSKLLNKCAHWKYM